MSKPLVYGTPISTYVRTVRLLLEEIGIDYHLESVDIFNGEAHSAAYLSKNPFGKVPTLVVEAQVIYETTAITDYINTVFGSDGFSPNDPLLKARMHQIIGIINNYLYPTAVGTIVVQRLIVPSQGGNTDQAKVNAAIVPAKTAIEAIELITIGNPYLLGSTVSIADCYLIPIFVYFSQTPEFEEITAQTPQLRTWWNLVSQLPSVKKVCA